MGCISANMLCKMNGIAVAAAAAKMKSRHTRKEMLFGASKILWCTHAREE